VVTGGVVADRPMQLNEARFELFNRCGYIPQEHCLHNDGYDPYKKTDVENSDPLILNIQVISILMFFADFQQNLLSLATVRRNLHICKIYSSKK